MNRTELLASLPWIVAAVGLVVTHLLSEARERRKELRAQFEKLAERLAALEVRGARFHGAASFDALEARAIEVEIASIERRAVRLAEAASVSLGDAAIAHRQSLTLRNFEVSSFTPQQPNSDILAEIEAATASYEEALEDVYREQYPSQFPYYRVSAPRSSDLLPTLVAIWVGLLLGVTATYLAMQP